MPPGGARTRSGPPPKANAIRPNKDMPDWLSLPAEGRKGRPPKWPLELQSEVEERRWREIWRRPQAVEWGRLGLELEVALYLRAVTIAEAPDAKAADRTTVRQAQDALGLSIPGMMRNRWRIAGVDSAQPEGPKLASVTAIFDDLEAASS